MEGVMTGIVDRENHAEIPFVGIGSDQGAMVRANETDGIRSLINNNTSTNNIYQPSYADLELKNDMESFANSRKLAKMLMERQGGIGSDIVAQALISGGLRAIGGAGAGKGKFAELATAFSPVVDRAFEQLQKRKDTELGLAAELYKGKNVGDLAEIRYAKEIARIEAIPEKDRSDADREILTNLRARQKEASPYLKGESFENRVRNKLDTWEKDNGDQTPSRARKLNRDEQAIVIMFEDQELTKTTQQREKSSGVDKTVYPPISYLEQVTNDTFKFKPTEDKAQKDFINKFIDGHRYFIPAIQKIAVFNNGAFTVTE